MLVPLMIGTTEILLLGGLALLLFGGKKLPEMMRGLGKGVKEFKEGMSGASPSETITSESHSEDGQQDKEDSPEVSK